MTCLAHGVTSVAGQPVRMVARIYDDAPSVLSQKVLNRWRSASQGLESTGKPVSGMGMADVMKQNSIFFVFQVNLTLPHALLTAEGVPPAHHGGLIRR